MPPTRCDDSASGKAPLSIAKAMPDQVMDAVSVQRRADVNWMPDCVNSMWERELGWVRALDCSVRRMIE